jgi:hypothetical protein
MSNSESESAMFPGFRGPMLARTADLMCVAEAEVSYFDHPSTRHCFQEKILREDRTIKFIQE